MRDCIAVVLAVSNGTAQDKAVAEKLQVVLMMKSSANEFFASTREGAEKKPELEKVKA